MELGIIGLARCGRSSLFNAATRGSAQLGAYSAQQRPNVGVVRVPDERVDVMARLFKPKKVTYAEIRWVDFPGAGFSAEGPGAQFLAELAGMDALVQVLRAFADEALPQRDSSVDPDGDAEALALELTFADLALIERRLSRLDTELRSARAVDRGPLERDRDLLLRLQAELEAGRPLRALALSDDERRLFAQYQFVTQRPLLLVVNIGEDEFAQAAEIEARFAERHGGPGVAAVALCAKLEAELATLPAAEAAEFRAALGGSEQAPLDRAIRCSYELLGLISFLTVGEDECRAWTVRRGALAPEAAGRVHSDMERGFIRAEVARWDELEAAGSARQAAAPRQAAHTGQVVRRAGRRRAQHALQCVIGGSRYDRARERR